MPAEILYLKEMARRSKAVSILSIGNSVSIDNGKFIVPCATEQSADVLVNILHKAYLNTKRRILSVRA